MLSRFSKMNIYLLSRLLKKHNKNAGHHRRVATRVYWKGKKLFWTTLCWKMMVKNAGHHRGRTRLLVIQLWSTILAWHLNWKENRMGGRPIVGQQQYKREKESHLCWRECANWWRHRSFNLCWSSTDSCCWYCIMVKSRHGCAACLGRTIATFYSIIYKRAKKRRAQWKVLLKRYDFCMHLVYVVGSFSVITFYLDCCLRSLFTIVCMTCYFAYTFKWNKTCLILSIVHRKAMIYHVRLHMGRCELSFYDKSTATVLTSC